jgi:hypothetical protein
MSRPYGTLASVNASGMPEPTAAFPDRPQNRVSVGQVFAFVAGFVALAAIGAIIGWNLTGEPTKPTIPITAPSPSPTVTAAPTTPTSAPATSASHTASGFVIPDYHSVGAFFIDARADLIAHKLGVTLTFNAGVGKPSTVVSTDPPAGTPVAKGITVKMYVSGPPPTLQVRATQGEPCAQAGRELAADGLLVSYSGSKSGLVAETNPAAGAPDVTWNQHIIIFCTPDGQLPSPSDDPSSPSDGSSQSPGTSG